MKARLLPLLALAAALFAAPALAAPTVTLTANPTSAISPASITLTWSSTEATACSASGGWSGSKATSGSQVLTNVTLSATYTLTCTGAVEDAVLTWTPPTLNTDGTAIATTGPGSLAKYKVYHAATAAGVATATPIDVLAPATTYTLTGLPVGPRYFGLKASTVAGIDSDMTATVTKTMAASSATASAPVTINTKPQPPLLTVNTVAYEVVERNGLFALGRYVGSVPLGTACVEPLLLTTGAGLQFFEVPRDAVQSALPPGQFKKVGLIAAPCAAG